VIGCPEKVPVLVQQVKLAPVSRIKLFAGSVRGRCLLQNNAETAASKFLADFNCSQSVIFAFCDDLSLDKNLALKIATGFGGGMGRQGEVCGAVTGGIMVLGLKYGRGEKDPPSAKDFTYARTRAFMQEFALRRGSYLCRDLLDGCDLTTEQGRRQFKDNDLLNKACLLCVRTAVEILVDMLKS
jgi:C_GCAxxG_C_C family probable redox protein